VLETGDDALRTGIPGDVFEREGREGTVAKFLEVGLTTKGDNVDFLLDTPSPGGASASEIAVSEEMR